MEEIMRKEILLRLELMHVIAELTYFLGLSLQDERFMLLSMFFCGTLFFEKQDGTVGHWLLHMYM
jgi:hypothetical protein